MRHQKSGRHLNRTAAHRKALLSNMSASLIEHETIKTTVVKAKELRRYVEPLITLSKTDSVANRRRAFAKLRNKAAVGKLFTELGPRYVDRPGGYTRILKAGYRQGDAAMVAYMQLMDQPEQIDAQEPEPFVAPAPAVQEEAATPDDDSSASADDLETAGLPEAEAKPEAVGDEPEVQADATADDESQSQASAEPTAGASEDAPSKDQESDKPKT